MALPEVLAFENPLDFRNRQVGIKYEMAKGMVIAETVEPEMPFSDLMKLRTASYDEEQRVKDIRDGLENGYLFSNLGISVLLTTSVYGRNFVVLSKRERKDMGDSVAMLISGYVDTRNLENPLNALDEEISEEFIPHTNKGEVLPGYRGELDFGSYGLPELLCFRLPKVGTPLPRPYANKKEQYSIERQRKNPNVPFKTAAGKGVSYTSERYFRVSKPPLYRIHDLIGFEFIINGISLGLDSPQLYFQVPSNSAQMVFSYHAEMEAPLASKLTIKDITLSHCEDRLADDGKGGKVVESAFHKDGFLLVEIEDGAMTERVFTFQDGGLIPYTGKILLSEAFAPKEDGIVVAKNISLDDYLRNR